MLLMLFIGLISFTAVSCTTTPTEQNQKTEFQKGNSASVVTPALVSHLVSSKNEQPPEVAKHRVNSYVVHSESKIVKKTPRNSQMVSQAHYSGHTKIAKPHRPVQVRPRIIRTH